MKLKSQIMMDEKGKLEHVVEVTGSFYCHVKPWLDFQKRYSLSCEEVGREVLAALQVDAWADIFNGLEPIITHPEKCKLDPAIREHITKMRTAEEEGKEKQ